MKLRDTTIGTRLTLGFGAVLFLVILLGITSYNQANLLWKTTDDLYNHPLITGRTARDIESHLLRIQVLMRDIALDDKFTEEQIRSSVNQINNYEKIVYDEFEIVYLSYLGPKPTIDTAYKYFKDWKPVRDELISLRISKGLSEAHKRLLSVNKGYVEKMLAETQKMIEFSNDKAAVFYSEAEIEKSILNTRLTILFVIIFAFSIVILYFLIETIRRPLKELVAVADNYRQGDYNARSDYESLNEIGTLASAFNKLATSVQNNVVIKENVAWVSRQMLNENDHRPFFRGLLNTLLSKTESQVAAVYFLNPESRLFEHYESIGLSNQRIRSFSDKSAEGEFGAVLIDKKILRITDIPDDTIFTFPTVAGEFKTKEIISIPIVSNNEVIAVISLAAIKNYSDLSIRLINDIWLTMTARILGVISYQKISDFSEVLELQNRELEQKSREMLMQADELKEYNIELELQKKQLDESNKLKSAFLSNMSHELRTPLNSVIALSGVLNRRLSGKIPEDEYNYLCIIEKNGKNLLSLINDILDLSRIEAGREELSYSEFSMCDLVNDIVNTLDPIINEKGIKISCEAPPDLPLIISDNTKCHHIIQNIVSNAVKFTEKGSVIISGFIQDENLHISVKDTGIGIPEEFLPFVFDEFRQADDKASRKFGGTGLGLAIVKKYCQLLNGSIDVTSKQGSGSVFTVVLPLKPSGIQLSGNDIESDHYKVKEHLSSDSMAETGSGKTLLLVEDSESQIIQLTDILRNEGYTIQVARNGREALDSIKKVIPDAMILDLQMPDVDGFEVLREIRNLRETKSIPVLILTAKHITKSELSFLKENHIYQLIQKGAVNRNDLLAYVKNLMVHKVKSIPDHVKPKKTQRNKDEKPTILVIEDNTDNLITLKALLEDRFIISSAVDGMEGLEKAVLVNPDLILLDISLPGMDGFKVLDEIRNNEKLNEIPVVALTARAMKGDRENLLAYGFDGYIAKPIDGEAFEGTILDFFK